VFPTIGVIIELPEMHELVDRTRVTLKITHKLTVVTALLERRESELLVEFGGLGHFPDVQSVSTQLI
jgi:hypothetical protein